MKITQISVFLENRAGRLAEVCRLFGDNAIDIKALNIAETESFGVMRLIVNDSAKALSLLKAHGFTATNTHVVAVEVMDRPSGLAEILEAVNESGLNIEYMYGFMERHENKAIMVFRFEDPEAAAEALQDKGIGVLTSDILL
ncbi:MAG: ACT domain-containing protein [Phycisphaerae bacterium]|jgi:hypothetical protein